MRVLVTGATGLIGHAIARELISAGHTVRALVRDIERARSVAPAGAQLVGGDITEPASLAVACRDVDWVFHAAGMPEQWQADDTIFDRVNRQGSVNLMNAALAAGVKRVVYTSTMDVFAAPQGGTLVEDRIDPNPKPTAYERSKQAAEREIEAVRALGLDVVFVNPGAVYGPSPVHIGANSMFIQFLNGEMPAVPPGGMALVYVDGVAKAHVAAATHGKNGERYLIGDVHADNLALVTLIAREAGVAKVPATAPAWLLKLVANVTAPLARLFGFKPLIAPGQLSFLLWNPRIDSGKAQRELGFVPTPLETGIRRTVAFLRERGLVPRAKTEK
jgi:nucleoside-diphosphate-sugar epimerase